MPKMLAAGESKGNDFHTDVKISDFPNLSSGGGAAVFNSH